jgi:hypothetical protein
MAVTGAARSLVAVGVLACVALCPQIAVADAPPRAVEVIATGEKSATVAVETLVRELLQRLPVVIRWVYAPEIDLRDVLSRRTADPGLAARVWVDLSDAAGARLFVANAASDHFLVRLVPAGDGHREVEQEAVAQIIGSAVDAILAGGEIGVTREVAVRQIANAPARDVTRVENAPIPLARPSSLQNDIAGGVGAFVAVRALGPGPAIGVDPGLMAAVGAPRRWPVQPLLILELHYDAPLDWPGNAVAVRIEGAGGSLQAGLRASIGSRVSIQASTGLGADALHAEPRALSGSDFTAREPFWLAATVVTVRAACEMTVAPRVSLVASAGFDVNLRGIEFNVSDNGSTQPNIVPWRVWPVVDLGVIFGLDDVRERSP